MFLQAIRLQSHGVLRGFWKLQGWGRHALASRLRRKRLERTESLKVPAAIAFSPTMRCNLSCVGCYARDYPQDNELPLETIDQMLASAERMGVFLFIITGGEPLLREGILKVFRNNRRILFLMITNSTLLDRETAKQIAISGNILPVVSLEGSQKETDARRGLGVYQQVERAMRHLKSQGVTFGFSAMVAKDNFQILGSEQFIDQMTELGCALGFYTEYVPLGSGVKWELVMEEKERGQFRERILQLRRTKPIILVHLPDDEYDDQGRCKAIIGGSVHVNAEGYVEPCPFAHFASDNIKEKGLDQVLRSQFLARLRSSDAIIRRGRVGCAMVENREILKHIAAQAGAQPTDCARKA